MTLEYLTEKMDPNKKGNLTTFIRTLRLAIKTRIALSLCCSRLKNEKELTRYLTHLINIRMNEFSRERRRHPHQERKISLFRSRIHHWVKQYKAKMIDKSASLSTPLRLDNGKVVCTERKPERIEFCTWVEASYSQG